MNQPKQFEARLERGTEGLGWTVARLPFDPHGCWEQMVRLRVRGSIGSPAGALVEFRTSLFPVSGVSGRFLLLVNNRLQREAGLSLGDVASFTLEPDLEPRPAELPDELASLLEEEPGLREFYASLSESMRREIGKWIVAVSSASSQRKRAEQMAERLLSAMDGERELPRAGVWEATQSARWVGEDDADATAAGAARGLLLPGR